MDCALRWPALSRLGDSAAQFRKLLPARVVAGDRLVGPAKAAFRAMGRGTAKSIAPRSAGTNRRPS